MLGIRNFVIGFCLSMFSVMLCRQLTSPTPIHHNHITAQPIKISLFKPHTNKAVSSHLLFAEVKKQTLEIATNNQNSLIETQSSEGLEDDEIISINFDDQIPIDFSVSTNNIEPASLSDELNKEQKVALLPDNDIDTLSSEALDTPWVTAKTKKSNKNKNLETLLSNHNENLFTESVQQLVKNDDAVSYKVAERIKQSIIFPIPDEILNDENLTPTFVNTSQTKTKKKKATTEKDKVVTKASIQTPSIKAQSRTFKKATSTESDANKVQATDNSGILDSISSWFNTPKQEETSLPESTPVAKKKKNAPTYGATNTTSKKPSQNKADELADIYSSLQETRQEYAHRKIVPSELKLSFQPGRAEISGSTLTWLKAFSEAAINDDIYLQVRLDASASTELQKKRLNLLYTIFMNNGVDFKKVDTVFSATEPNAFIIRTIRIK